MSSRDGNEATKQYAQRSSFSSSDEDDGCHRRHRKRKSSKHHRKSKDLKHKRSRRRTRSSSSCCSSSSGGYDTSSSELSQRRSKKKRRKQERKSRRVTDHHDHNGDNEQDHDITTIHRPNELLGELKTKQGPTNNHEPIRNAPSQVSNNEPTPHRRNMAPMTREQYEAKRSEIREEYDAETGRYRLVRGTGEVLERIVSRDEHLAINRQATRGDGASFMRNLYRNSNP